MQPLLDSNETAAIQARTAPGDQRGLERRIALGVLGAVLVAGQVAVLAVEERIHRAGPLEGRRQRPFQRVRAQRHLAAILAAQPAPQRGGRGRQVDAGRGEHRIVLHALDGLAEAEHQRMADTHHQLVTIGGRGQAGQGRGHLLGLGNAEKQVATHHRNRGENAWLSRAHVASIYHQAVRRSWRCTFDLVLVRAMLGFGAQRRATPSEAAPKYPRILNRCNARDHSKTREKREVGPASLRTPSA